MKRTELNKLTEAAQRVSDSDQVNEFFDGDASPEWKAERAVLNSFRKFMVGRAQRLPSGRNESEDQLYFKETKKLTYERFARLFRAWVVRQKAPEGYKRPAMDGVNHALIGWTRKGDQFDVDCYISEDGYWVDGENQPALTFSCGAGNPRYKKDYERTVPTYTPPDLEGEL